MRPTILFVLLLLAGPAMAGVLLQEGFEPGFTGAGWIWTDAAGDGSWSSTADPVRTGTGSLELSGKVGNIYLSWDFEAAMHNTVAEAWFYDDDSPTLESFVSVSADPNYQNLTNGHLKVGTSCLYDGGNYTVAEGWHASGYVVGPSRSLGWHKVTIENVEGVNHCYVDDQLVHSTTFQGDWRYLILNEDNHCTTGSSWFDDVLVQDREPIQAGARSWSAIKVHYSE